MTERPFDPDWVISPGETLRDWMEEACLSVRVTASACGMPELLLQNVVDGKQEIDGQIAARLQRGTLIPARLWLNLERAYREGLAAGKKDASRG